MCKRDVDVIHKVKNCNVTLTSPDMGEGGMEVHHSALIERVIMSQHDADEIHRSLLLILKAGNRPVVTIFEPFKKERYL